MSEDNKKQNESVKKPSQELSAEDLKQVAGGTGLTTPDTIKVGTIKGEDGSGGGNTTQLK